MKNKFIAFLSEFSKRISCAPVEFWFVLGLFVSLLFFYFIPTFFRYDESMARGFDYIAPRTTLIGGDLVEIVNDMSGSFLFGEPRFVLKGPYPPFSVLFHMPLVFVDTRTSFILNSLLSLSALVFLTLILPGCKESINGKRSFLIALFLTGFFSYGFHFEVERGQFNLIAFGFALTSIWVFHNYPSKRWLAYLLFTAAVQLKVYPVFFILNLVDDWRDWKGIFKRFVGLGLLNLAMLFIFGIGNFILFFTDISHMASSDVSISINHSTGSFVVLVVDKFPFLSAYSGYLTAAILGFIFLCLVLIGYQSYKNKFNELNPFFILACAAAAQLIPRTSYDYTLSGLPAAMALFLIGAHKIKPSVVASLALFVVCAAYGSTLFASPFKYAAKELFPILTPFSNNFFALLIILIAVTILSFYMRPGQTTLASQSEKV